MKFEIGQVVYSVGLNSKCKKVVAKSTIVELWETEDKDGFDCVTLSGGLKIKDKTRDLYATKSEVKIEK